MNFWGWFWLVAICGVSTLAVLDNWERISAWARRRLSRSGINGDIPAGHAIAPAAMVAPAPAPSPTDGARTAKRVQWGQWLSGGARGAREAESHARPFQAQPLDKQGPNGDSLAARARPFVHGVAAFAGFLWRRPFPLLFFAGFVVIALTFSGCVPDWGKSKDELRFERELAQAEAETQAAINARDAAIAQAAQDAALSRERIRQASQRGRDAIAAATPENEAPLDPELVRALRLALDELCIVRADGSRADSCGPNA